MRELFSRTAAIFFCFPWKIFKKYVFCHFRVEWGIYCSWSLLMTVIIWIPLLFSLLSTYYCSILYLKWEGLSLISIYAEQILSIILWKLLQSFDLMTFFLGKLNLHDLGKHCTWMELKKEHPRVFLTWKLFSGKCNSLCEKKVWARNQTIYLKDHLLIQVVRGL